MAFDKNFQGYGAEMSREQDRWDAEREYSRRECGAGGWDENNGGEWGGRESERDRLIDYIQGYYASGRWMYYSLPKLRAFANEIKAEEAAK